MTAAYGFTEDGYKSSAVSSNSMFALLDQFWGMLDLCMLYGFLTEIKSINDLYMMKSWYEKLSTLLDICEGIPPVTSGFPS